MHKVYIITTYGKVLKFNLNFKNQMIILVVINQTYIGIQGKFILISNLIKTQEILKPLELIIPLIVEVIIIK